MDSLRKRVVQLEEDEGRFGCSIEKESAAGSVLESEKENKAKERREAEEGMSKIVATAVCRKRKSKRKRIGKSMTMFHSSTFHISTLSMSEGCLSFVLWSARRVDQNSACCFITDHLSSLNPSESEDNNHSPPTRMVPLAHELGGRKRGKKN